MHEGEAYHDLCFFVFDAYAAYADGFALCVEQAIGLRTHTHAHLSYGGLAFDGFADLKLLFAYFLEAVGVVVVIGLVLDRFVQILEILDGKRSNVFRSFDY